MNMVHGTYIHCLKITIIFPVLSLSAHGSKRRMNVNITISTLQITCDQSFCFAWYNDSHGIMK